MISQMRAGLTQPMSPPSSPNATIAIGGRTTLPVAERLHYITAEVAARAAAEVRDGVELDRALDRITR